MRQVVVIHGGTTFETHDAYIAYLKTRDVNLEAFKMKSDWKPTLQTRLGEGVEVLLPNMPNKTNAQYSEWKIWFERMLTFVGDGGVFVGHSLGGIFLAKYFAEEGMSRSVRALILVAAPFDDANGAESLVSFELPPSLSRVEEHVKKIYILHSTDDPVVPFSQAEKYKKALGSAEVLSLSGKKHCNDPDFPELVNLLKEVCTAS